jgi:hypothetical protein
MCREADALFLAASAWPAVILRDAAELIKPVVVALFLLRRSCTSAVARQDGDAQGNSGGALQENVPAHPMLGSAVVRCAALAQ